MERAIRAIIQEVPQGKIFDSHFVINQLISNYSDEYLIFAGSVNASSKKTNVVHMRIGQKIKQFVDLVEQVGEGGEFWSGTIHGHANECTGWKRK